MELKDVLKIEKEGTMSTLSKEDRLKGGIILKRTGEELLAKAEPWIDSVKDELSVGEQLSIPMGSITYKAKKKESITHKAVVTDSEFIDVLKRTGHDKYITNKEVVNRNQVYKDAASGKITNKDVLDCFERLVNTKIDINK